jgi:hypothetical protein
MPLQKSPNLLMPRPKAKARPRSTTGAGARLEALGGDNGAVVIARCTRALRGSPVIRWPNGRAKVNVTAVCRLPHAKAITGQIMLYLENFNKAAKCLQNRGPVLGGVMPLRGCLGSASRISWMETALLGRVQPQTQQTGFASRKFSLLVKELLDRTHPRGTPSRKNTHQVEWCLLATHAASSPTGPNLVQGAHPAGRAPTKSSGTC